MSNSYVINEIQVSYKRPLSFDQMPKISGAESAYKILHSLWDENRIDFVEDFKMLLLNRANRVIGIHHVSSGSSSGTIADPKMVFVTALKTNASGIILAHNHPSGNLNPSEQDKTMTKRMIDAGQLLEIKIFDHIILANEGYYSFSEGMKYQKVTRSMGVYFEAMEPF